MILSGERRPTFGSDLALKIDREFGIPMEEWYPANRRGQSYKAAG